ncbi:hypothetical protein D9M69_567110 [compost metagenome]
MLGGERGQRGRHHAAAESEAAADPQQAAGFAPGNADLLDQVVHIVEDALRPVVDALARLADHDAPGGAMEQGRAQAVLEQTDALGDVGGRHAQGLGRAGETGSAHHRAQDAQVGGKEIIIHDSCIVISQDGLL